MEVPVQGQRPDHEGAAGLRNRVWESKKPEFQYLKAGKMHLPAQEERESLLLSFLFCVPFNSQGISWRPLILMKVYLFTQSMESNANIFSKNTLRDTPRNNVLSAIWILLAPWSWHKINYHSTLVGSIHSSYFSLGTYSTLFPKSYTLSII